MWVERIALERTRGGVAASDRKRRSSFHTQGRQGVALEDGCWLEVEVTAHNTKEFD